MTLARHALRLLAEGLAVAAVLGVAVVWPPVRQPARADAVILLSGDGGRLPAAMRLMERQVASTLVFVGQPDTGEVLDICRLPQAFEVVCLRPSPDNTRTEARAAAALAAERRWEDLVLVTSRFHMARARLYLRRCFDGSVATFGDYPDYGREFARRQVMHEWLGLVHASVLARGC